MPDSNPNSRLEAFCDGVFAFALTLLIVDIKIPAGEVIQTTRDLWLALFHLLPSLYAFLLSFGIVLVTWFNHQATLKLVDKSSPPFIFANGFLLLTVVIIPFPTALLADYLFTDHAAPAVVLYSAVYGLQAIGWILLGYTALKAPRLTRNEQSTLAMRGNYQKGYFALALYSVLTLLAFWFPLAIAMLTSVIMLGWLAVGIFIKSE